MAELLVVEDDPHNLELMIYLLEAAGHAVVPAATGRGAVAAAAADPPDLAVLDLHLPDISGFEVLLQLRARLGRTFPAVAVTADAMVGVRDNALNAGFDDYLAKPIDPPSFAQTIDEYLPEPLRGHRPRSRWSVS